MFVPIMCSCCGYIEPSPPGGEGGANMGWCGHVWMNGNGEDMNLRVPSLANL